MKKLAINELIDKANFVRKDVVTVCTKNGAGHIAPSLSCVDILTALYYNVLNINDDPGWEDRDRLVFSKSHGCYGVYSILCDIGFLKREDWDNFYKGSFLAGCMEQSLEHGIEAGCGALGHGLSIAVGIAFGAKLQNKKYKTYCLVGDGEMQEGSCWEAVQFAVKHELENLIVIIDKNKLQAMEFVDDVLTIKGREDDLERKLEAFGFKVATCNGHDPAELVKKLEELNNLNSVYPRVLVADTIKGYGLKCMENVPKFHFRLPTEEEIAQGFRHE